VYSVNRGGSEDFWRFKWTERSVGLAFESFLWSISIPTFRCSSKSSLHFRDFFDWSKLQNWNAWLNGQKSPNSRSHGVVEVFFHLLRWLNHQSIPVQFKISEFTWCSQFHRNSVGSVVEFVWPNWKESNKRIWNIEDRLITTRRMKCKDPFRSEFFQPKDQRRNLRTHRFEGKWNSVADYRVKELIVKGILPNADMKNALFCRFGRDGGRFAYFWVFSVLNGFEETFEYWEKGELVDILWPRRLS
jgi:hypothetical protein